MLNVKSKILAEIKIRFILLARSHICMVDNQKIINISLTGFVFCRWNITSEIYELVY